MQAYSSFTEYPELFKNTYWGGRRAKPDVLQTNPEFAEIIANRNLLVQEYDLTKSVSSSIVPAYVYGLTKERTAKFDHPEFYQDAAEDWVIINSPYKVTDEEKDTLYCLGWYPIIKVYDPSADSFMKIVPKNKRYPTL